MAESVWSWDIMAALTSAEEPEDEVDEELEEFEGAEKGLVRAMALWFWVYVSYPIRSLFSAGRLPDA